MSHQQHYTILVILLLLSTSVLVFSGGDELKAVEQNNNSTTVVKPKPVDPEKKGVDKVDGTKEGVKDDAENVPKVNSDKDHLSGGKEGASGEQEIKKLPKEEATKEKPVKPAKEENARGEECGSSITCVDEKNKLTACLRVPGNDSPELSLLIQNKGASPLTIKISAPDYVKLENDSIQLPDKKTQEVKVTIGKGNKNTLIVLTAKDSTCSIDFKDLISHNSEKKADDTPNSALIGKITTLPSLAILCVLALVLVASAFMCIKFRLKHVAIDSSKYQKLETELPVSSVGKKETDEGDGWDDSWGDSWDDEEAPKTPSMPITPSLSSKGLASRKLSKDSWKD